MTSGHPALRPKESALSDPYRPLEEYGAIGDGRTAALISAQGSVDWLCLPRFDSPSVFAALLDAKRGGGWILRPRTPLASRAEYLPGTNILVTTYGDESPRARVTDFMPPGAPRPALLRKMEALGGPVTFECQFAPRPDYARRQPDLSATSAGVIGEGLSLAISDPIAPSRLSAETAVYQTDVAPDRPVWLGLTAGQEPPDLRPAEDWLRQTAGFWREKVGRLEYGGPYQADVTRSALALHLLIHAPTGAPLAAATASVPERIGGAANWDYRYSWLRDSSYMLSALVHLGSLEEAGRYLRWLADVCPEGQRLPAMFDLDGRREIPEFTLDHFEGYRGSRPVRIGNAASTQHQLDVFGALVELAWDFQRRGGEIEAAVWRFLSGQVDWVLMHWRQPDSGIWEPRIPPQHHVYSKVMAWVALDRGSAMARQRRDTAADRWQASAEEVRADIEAHGWDESLHAYPMFYGGDSLDAALIRMAALGYAAPDEPRTAATLAAIRRSLVEEPHVFRYRSPDGSRPEGSFLLLSFWLVQALALAGEREEAGRIFKELRGMQSPLGLYAEMVEPASGQLVGNFPQGFTHLGVIEGALALDDRT